MQNAECAVKTLAVLRGGCVLWNLKPTEFVISLTLAEGNGSGRFWLPTCAILHGMQVFNIALVQMVYYGPSVCVNIATGWNLLLSLSRTAQLSWSAMLITFFVADYGIFACWKCFITRLADTSCTSETLSRISQMSFWVWVTLDLSPCMHLSTYLWLCCVNSAVFFSLLLPMLPLGYLPFFWLLLSSRDKVQWCLPAP